MSGLGKRMRSENTERAVAPVVGFILIFAILIILLSMYQALWVPIQNEEVEFDHYQDVKDDMTDVRSAVFEARTTGQTQSTTVKLGTRYPNRVLAINPPPSTGRLETGERRNISLANQDGTEIDIPARFPGIASSDEVYTQFISYTPNYRELDTGAPIRHEHGLLYMDYNETENGGGLVIHNEKQTLVQTYEEGTDEVTLVPIQGNYSERGVERVSMDPEPGILVTREFEDVNLTVPTDLSETTWEEVLADELAPENVVVDEAAGELTLVLDGVWGINYAPVGVDGSPVSGTRGSTSNEINPASPGDVRLASSERLDSQNAWTATFNNTGGTTNFTEARVSFYSSQKGDTDTLESIEFPDGSNQALYGLNWGIADSFAQLDPPIRLEGNGSTTQMQFNFNDVKNQDGFFVIEFIFENGERGTYFVGDNPETIGNGNANNGNNQAPNADFEISDGKNDNFWDLDAANSSDSDGTIQSYEWYDGTDTTGNSKATGETVTDFRADPGDDITLVVTDNDGAESSITKTV